MKTNRYTYLLLTACICMGITSFAQGVCSGSALAPVFKQDFGTSAALVNVGYERFSSVTQSDAYTPFSNNNLLSITVAVGSNSPVCVGNTLTLTSTPSGGTAPYTYMWTGPNGFISVQQNPTIPNITTADNGNYSVTVVDAAANSVMASVAVIVNALPAIEPITGNAYGCVGSTIALSDITPGGIWSSSNTAVATVNNSGLVTIVSLGTATISYTVTTNGCSAAATKTITTASVVLHPDLIECNNGISAFDANDIYYGVTYSNSNGGNTYAWSVTGGSFSYQGASTAASQYPRMQLLTGSAFQVVVQFTTNGVTCVDTQMVYKNTTAADTIQGSHDTTVCFNTAPLNLSGKVSAVTNNVSWTTSGSGIFSNPGALSTTYTPSAADKAAGLIKIYLSGSSTLNSNGNCGTATSIDSMTLRIYPNNTGTNVISTLCSKQTLTYIPVSVQAGSIYNWTSSFTSGSGSGNTASGNGTISDILINSSTTTDATVEYIITPSYNGCAGVPFTLTATVKPVPAITITNNTTPLCSGNTTNIQFSSSITGSSYTWSSFIISGTASGHSSNGVGRY